MIETERSIEWLGVWSGYTLLRHGSLCYAVPLESGSWDITAKALRNNPQVLRGDSLADLEKCLEGLRRYQEGLDTPHERPQLMEEGRAGFDLYRYQSRYFAIPTGQPFDIDHFRARAYGRAIFGHTLRDLEDEIRHRAQAVQQRVLFIASVPGSSCSAFLRRLDGSEIVLLALPGQTNLPQGVEVIRYSSEGTGAEPFDADRVSPTFLSELRDRQFNLVAIPYEGREWWGGTRLERFAAALADRILIMFASGQDRLYRGEDVRRIQYNKAYLNSMFRHVPPLKGKRVLELGASDGLACDLLLTEEPRQIVGVDVVDIVGCGYSHSSIEYRNLDGCDLPFEDNAFDLALSIATLEHVREPINTIKEMVRVTAPGGYCYIQAGPLYFSPFGHHMFGYFDDCPWIHLRMSVQEIVAEAIRRNLDERFRRERGESVEDYVRSMLDSRHVNGKTFAQYGLHSLARDAGVEIIRLQRSYEGENLLTDDIMRQVFPLSAEDLLAHGFEVVLKKNSRSGK